MCVHACKHFTKKVMLKSMYHEAMLTVGTFSYNTRTIMLADFTPTLNINTTLQLVDSQNLFFNELYTFSTWKSFSYIYGNTNTLSCDMYVRKH